VAIDADIRAENYRHIDLGQNALGVSAETKKLFATAHWIVEMLLAVLERELEIFNRGGTPLRGYSRDY
jgi:hypothetical protein